MFTQKPLALVMSAICGLAMSTVSLADDTQTTEQAAAKTSKKTTSVKSSSVEEVYVQGTYTTRSMNGATGIDMSLRETPQTVTIMTSQMIEDKGLVDMEQVLDHVPGMSKVGDASEYSIMYVRGFQLDTGVQVDGMITTPANGTYAGDISQGTRRLLSVLKY
jgi:outer-membrane receptor for ferric coprogen and ferric-rhodotorulic acid